MKKTIASLALCLCLAGLYAEEFAYKQEAGSKYRVLSTVHEDVYIDRRLDHRSEIVNRIAIEITEAANGRAVNRATFQTGEKAVKAGARTSGYQWDKDYASVFERDAQGRITIGSEYYMPVVRNVPVFPARALTVGDTWTAEGHEMHDFRASFGISEPYRIPFTATYTFLGTRTWRNVSYPAFSVSYRIFIEPQVTAGTVYPTRIMGASDQVMYWDAELGMEPAYTERFRMVFELSNASTIEFRGTAEAEVVESELMNKQSIARDIEQSIADLGIKDASVKVVDNGISISLENIQFLSESAVLRDSEKEKLDKIGSILKQYQDRDILVEGHTALAGSVESMQTLSEERAQTVGDYLISRNVRTPDRVVIRGYGGDKPVSDNSTEAGKARNRRVEITILEN